VEEREVWVAIVISSRLEYPSELIRAQKTISEENKGLKDPLMDRGPVANQIVVSESGPTSTSKPPSATLHPLSSQHLKLVVASTSV
jgi:hypothetical protein